MISSSSWNSLEMNMCKYLQENPESCKRYLNCSNHSNIVPMLNVKNKRTLQTLIFPKNALSAAGLDVNTCDRVNWIKKFYSICFLFKQFNRDKCEISEEKTWKVVLDLLSRKRENFNVPKIIICNIAYFNSIVSKNQDVQSKSREGKASE